jgi:hypothetical protein
MQFCEWLQHQRTADKLFLHESVSNVRNGHLWARDNPHFTREQGYKIRFSVRVWTGIVEGIDVGPYMLPDRLAEQ